MSAITFDQVDTHEMQNEFNSSEMVPSNLSAEWHPFADLFVKEYYAVNFEPFNEDEFSELLTHDDSHVDFGSNILSCLHQNDAIGGSESNSFNQPVETEVVSSSVDCAKISEQLQCQNTELQFPIANYTEDLDSSSNTDTLYVNCEPSCHLSHIDSNHNGVPKPQTAAQKGSRRKLRRCDPHVIVETIFNGSIADIVKTRKRGAKSASVSTTDPAATSITASSEAWNCSPKVSEFDFAVVQNNHKLSETNAHFTKSLKALKQESTSTGTRRDLQQSDSVPKTNGNSKAKSRSRDSSASRKHKATDLGNANAKGHREAYDSVYLPNSVQEERKSHKKTKSQKVPKHNKPKDPVIHLNIPTLVNSPTSLSPCSLPTVKLEDIGRSNATCFSVSNHKESCGLYETKPIFSNNMVIKIKLAKTESDSSSSTQNNLPRTKKKLKGIEEYKAHKAKCQQKGLNILKDKLFDVPSASSSPNTVSSSSSLTASPLLAESYDATYQNAEHSLKNSLSTGIHLSTLSYTSDNTVDYFEKDLKNASLKHQSWPHVGLSPDIGISTTTSQSQLQTWEYEKQFPESPLQCISPISIKKESDWESRDKNSLGLVAVKTEPKWDSGGINSVGFPAVKSESGWQNDEFNPIDINIDVPALKIEPDWESEDGNSLGLVAVKLHPKLLDEGLNLHCNPAVGTKQELEIAYPSQGIVSQESLSFNTAMDNVPILAKEESNLPHIRFLPAPSKDSSLPCEVKKANRLNVPKVCRDIPGLRRPPNSAAATSDKGSSGDAPCSTPSVEVKAKDKMLKEITLPHTATSSQGVVSAVSEKPVVQGNANSIRSRQPMDVSKLPEKYSLFPTARKSKESDCERRRTCSTSSSSSSSSSSSDRFPVAYKPDQRLRKSSHSSGSQRHSNSHSDSTRTKSRKFNFHLVYCRNPNQSASGGVSPHSQHGQQGNSCLKTKRRAPYSNSSGSDNDFGYNSHPSTRNQKQYSSQRSNSPESSRNPRSYKYSKKQTKSRSRSPLYNNSSKYSRSPKSSYKPRRRYSSSYSTASSCSRYSSRSRSRSPYSRHHSRTSQQRYSLAKKILWQEQQKQIDERRVVYVGRIPDHYSKEELQTRFSSFGSIEDVRIHQRATRMNDNFGFITFKDKDSAYKAVEFGNGSSLEPKFDISFGGRRRFCKKQYSDLDKEDEVNRSPRLFPVPRQEDNFDSLLQAELQRIKSKKKY